MSAAVFLLLAAAPLIGSFLAVLVVRLPARRTVVFGRSACDHCGHALAAFDLVPVVSFVASRARCRYCGGGIARVHLFMELGAAAVALWAALLTSGWVLAASCLFGWVLLTLAAIDWRALLLPDVLTLPLLGCGLVAAVPIDRGALGGHLIGAVAGYLALAGVAALYRAVRGREGVGLGDAKLLAAIGAWVSYEGVPSVVLLAAVLALSLVAVRAAIGQGMERGTKIPFGTFLAAGGWIVWLYGPVVGG